MARAGDVVGGKYCLIHPLGMGGMGTVWRAEHVALKQQVALKLLTVRGPQAERTVKRFQREAQIAASIRHRNIVYISDFGTDCAEPYIVMELLVGVPLSERMVVGEPLGVGTFLSLMEETLQGLSAVHAAGVVHRDMKPENIFLVRESDGTVFPKLLDFGVSRSTARGQGHTITREGIVMGTPEYVSPEQARGRMADTRSDIYSLGVVMYEAIAGRLPFQADNPADLIVAVLNATPLPLSTFRPELGQRLSDLVAKAMSRDPDGRFQTTEEMRGAILSLQESEPQLAMHSLPRRFLAPSPSPGRGGAENEEQDALDRQQESAGTVPMTPQPELIEGATAVIPVRRKLPLRWVATGLAVALALAGSLAFLTDSSRAGPPRAPEPELTQRGPEEFAAPFSAKPPAAPAEVVVELFGVPSEARVLVDGARAAGSTLRFPRGSGLHEIVVEAPGKERWRVSHDSERDGRYAIALEPERRAAARPVRAPSPAKPKGGLLRKPDF